MCLLVTVTLPADANVAALRALSKDLALRPMEESPMRARLGPDERYYSTATAMCSCGSFLGSARGGGHGGPITPAKLEKLRRKGWSAKKIEDWVATKAAVNASWTTDQAAWRAWIHEGIEGGRVASLGVLLHWYRGDFAHESFGILREERVTVNLADDAFLSHLEHDVLYRFVRA